MWNWNIRQRLFARTAIGRTGQSTTSEYQPILLGNVSVPSKVVELSSMPLELSKDQAILAVTPLGIIPLRDSEKRDGVQKTDI